MLTPMVGRPDVTSEPYTSSHPFCLQATSVKSTRPVTVVAYEPTGLDLTVAYLPDRAFAVPEVLAEQFPEALAEWEARLAFDSVRVQPSRVFVRNNVVKVEGGPIRYSELRALKQCLKSLGGDSPAAFARLPAGFISSIGLVVHVVSREGLMLTALRGDKVAVHANEWTLGLGEGLEAKDFQARTLEPAVLRALSEELHIVEADVSAAAVKVLGLIRNQETLDVTVVAVADMRNTSPAFAATEILRRAAAADDAWEHAQLVFIPTDRESLDRTVTNGGSAKVPGMYVVFDILVGYLSAG